MSGQPRKSFEEVRAILNDVKFMDREIRLLRKKDGYLLQIQYWEQDVENPEGPLVLQRARKWYLSPYSTETEIVETAFKACRVSMDHVLKEHFLYKGHRVYSPHFKIEARIQMCKDKAFDSRIPIQLNKCSDCGTGIFQGPEQVRLLPGGFEDRYRVLRYGCTCDGSPPLPAEGWEPVTRRMVP